MKDMIILVLGGSKSGKSAYAESVACEDGEVRYYIATMKVSDEEGINRIKRHRSLREGKRFITIERSSDVGDIVDEGLITDKKSVVLLECITNLLANELFDNYTEEEIITDKNKITEKIVDKITKDILKLSDNTDKLVLVSGIFATENNTYDKVTNIYIEMLNELNNILTSVSNIVVEVSSGIPRTIKEKI